MRGGKYVVVLAGVAALAAGCATKTAPGPVSLTAAVTQTRAQTADITVTTSMQTQGMSMTFTETGSFDFAHARGTVSMRQPLGMTMVFLAPHVYLKVTGGGGMSLPGGKSWVDLGAAPPGWSGAAAASAATGAASSPFTDTTSPADLLAALTAVSGSVRNLGPGTVRGVPVTGLRVNVDGAKAAARLPSAERADFESLISAFGGHEIPVEVWVDGHNLVRRLRVTFPLPGAATGSVYSETTDYYDFGVKVMVSAPPASQVASISQLKADGSAVAAASSGGSAGLGGSGGLGGPAGPAGSASPPKESGTLSESQAAAAGQAVSAFWSALGHDDPSAVAGTVLPAQRGCVGSGMVGGGAPKLTVSGFRITSVRPAGAGKATVRYTVSATAEMNGQSFPVLPDGETGGQWLVAAESGGHWYVDIDSNSDFPFSC